MQRKISTHAIGIVLTASFAASAVFVFSYRLSASAETMALHALETPLPVSPIAPETLPAASLPISNDAPARDLQKETLAMPMERALERVTKKPFGIEIHPETSPVPNDRFDGLHVGVDFETFEDEQNIDVPVFAVCDGRLLFKKQARGYGGVAVQACRIENREVSVIYGHLDLANIGPQAGDVLVRGQRIGVLGEGYSQETDGVRKHLHLGIREGFTNDIRGYVKSATETPMFLNALDYLK